MDIKTLIEQAREKDLLFNATYMYEVELMGHKPTIEWLMPKLEAALGKNYVRQAAKAYTDSQKVN